MKIFINDNCIYRVKPGNLPMKGKAIGATYTWQFYLRKALYNQQFAKSLGHLFWELFIEDFKKKPFQICGCETAGTPITCAIQHSTNENINIFVIRKEQKKYGLLNWVEGTIEKDLPILLVDDLAASQITLRMNEQLLKTNGYEIYDKYFALVDKRGRIEGAHIENLLEKELVSIFTSDDFDLYWNDYIYRNKKEPIFIKSF